MFRREVRAVFLLLGVVAILGASNLVEAQKCFPDCREGYVCARGECVTACNPPCPEGERCTSDSRCVAATPPLPQAAAATAALPAGSYIAPKDKALVVFVRPAKLGKAVYFYVLDESKKLVTLFKGNEHAAITTLPGKHTFYVVSENAGAVQAELGAGRTYIILTQPKMGLGKARVIVEPILRSSSNFKESAAWVRDTKAGAPDFDKGNKWVRKHQDAINKRIGDAKASTMGVADGRTQEEAGALWGR